MLFHSSVVDASASKPYDGVRRFAIDTVIRMDTEHGISFRNACLCQQRAVIAEYVRHLA
jgi:hypothetical protein